MSDFGNDVANTVFNLTGKVMSKLMSAIISLFSIIYKSWQGDNQGKIRKELLNAIKDQKVKRKILKKIQGKTGYIKFKDMQKSGIKCTALGISMTKDEMKKFSEYCKREGVVFTATISKDDIDKHKKVYNILCPESDKERIKNVIERMNKEKSLRLVDEQIEKIEKIESKDSLDKNDTMFLDHLKKLRKETRKDYCDLLNDEQISSIFEDIFNETNDTTKEEKTDKDSSRVSFEQAINHYTGGELDKDEYTIICDAQDPTKCIKCHGYNDTFNKKTYIKTDYEVYNGNKMVYQTNDGRFKGRPKDYWKNETLEMKSKGGFSDTVLKFYSIEEYEKWAQNVIKQNKEEFQDLQYDNSSGRDYDGICSKLEKDLYKNDAIYKNGVVLDSKTGEPLSIRKDMSPSEKATITESILIGKQIDTYKALNDIEADLAIANVNVITAPKGTPEHKEASYNYEEIQKRYDNARKTEGTLMQARKEINSVQAVEKANKYEKEYTSHSERVDEIGKDKMGKDGKTIIDYKGKIENMRNKARSKPNDHSDRDVNKPQKTSKSKVANDR